MTLFENLDYRRKLTQQFPLPPHRVAVAHSAMHVAACRITVDGVIEHQLDWCAVRTADEGHYLCAVLNSPVTTRAATPYMTSGKGGGRHIGKSLWNVPIPLFEPTDPLHADLARLGEAAERVVGELELTASTHGAMRRAIRAALAGNELGARIDAAVERLLASVGG